MKQQIFLALRQNLIPGLFLWFFGLLMVAGFYYVEGSRPWFEQIIQLKLTYGYAYSAVSTALFGGLIPYVFMRLSGRDRQGSAWGMGAVFVGYWALRGIDVDAFYRLQAFLFGQGVDWKTIASKVCVDQFVYCVIWATPVTALFYGWKEAGYSVRRWKREKKVGEFWNKMIIFNLTTWMVWTPATAIVYSLPSPLQIPLFNLTLCFFVLLVSMYGKKEAEV
jgi:hypothetical protein